MTKTMFKFDETIVKDAVTNNLPRLTDTIEYIVMDIMQAHCAEFDTELLCHRFRLAFILYDRASYDLNWSAGNRRLVY